MDPLDKQLINFVLKWAPFDGPPEEDAFSEFGLNTRGVYLRAQRIIDSYRGRLEGLPDLERHMLKQAADHLSLVAPHKH